MQLPLQQRAAVLTRLQIVHKRRKELSQFVTATGISGQRQEADHCFLGSSASQFQTTTSGQGLSFWISIERQLFHFLNGKIVPLDPGFSCCSFLPLNIIQNKLSSWGEDRVFEQNKPLIFYTEENSSHPRDTAVLLSETQFSPEIGQTIWEVIQVPLEGGFIVHRQWGRDPAPTTMLTLCNELQVSYFNRS